MEERGQFGFMCCDFFAAVHILKIYGTFGGQFPLCFHRFVLDAREEDLDLNLWISVEIGSAFNMVLNESSSAL